MKTILLAVSAAASLFSASCSTLEKHQASYLTDQSNLRPERDDRRALVARSPIPASSFGAVRIDTIQFMAPTRELTSDEKQILQQRLEAALNERFRKQWPASSSSVRHTLEIRGAITAVEKANVPLNVVAELAINFPVDMGGVAVDLEAISRPDGARVAAARYTIPGRPWQMFRSLSQLGQAKHGVDVVADKFYTLVTGAKPEAAPMSSPSLIAKR